MHRSADISRFTASHLNPTQRDNDLERLRSEEFDVLIVGAGVVGAGAALDAASRGLRVALLEQRDFAAGTSSRSSKLIHGGLRYLENLDFGLVREALMERGGLLTTLAPHLVKPVPFLAPLEHRIWQRLYYGAGITLYDWMGTLFGTPRGVPMQKHYSRSGARELFKGMKEDALIGAIRYYDAQVDDARFVATLARTAASNRAAVVRSARLTRLKRDSDTVVGAYVTDEETGEEISVSAKVTIAATGVWSDDIGEMLGGRAGLRVRASKGIHLVVPRTAIPSDVGLILRTEKSVLFIIPWGGHWIIGTTDTDWDLDRAHPAASRADIQYLLDHVNTVLEKPLTHDDIEGVYAGLRPLLAGEDESTSKLSREHAVVEPAPGLMLIAGGKFTTYRVMAEDVIDVAAERLSEEMPGILPSRTDQLPVLGADGYARAWADRAQSAPRHGVSRAVIERLLERYGTLSYELLSLVDERRDLAEPVTGAPDYIRAEIVYAASAEGALHLDDVLTRRTRISIETSHRGVECVEEVADLVGEVLGWSASTRDEEVEQYRRRVAAERESQQMPDDRTADAARLGTAALAG